MLIGDPWQIGLLCFYECLRAGSRLVAIGYPVGASFANIGTSGGLLLYGCGSITNAAIDGWRISFLLAGGVSTEGVR